MGARAAYLEAGAAGQATPQLGEGAADLVLHGRLALLVVNGDTLAAGEDAAAGGARRGGSCVVVMVMVSVGTAGTASGEHVCGVYWLEVL